MPKGDLDKPNPAYAGTLVKTIRWEHSRFAGGAVFPAGLKETRLSYGIKAQGSAQNAERLRWWTIGGGASRKCVGTLLK